MRAPDVVIDAPDSFEVELEALQDVVIHRNAKEIREIEFCLTFVSKLTEVNRAARLVSKKTRGDAVVWLAYPKASSKSYQCEFNRDTGWKALGDAGFEGVRQVAIDDDWSALRFRRAEFIKKMTRKTAISRKGKARASSKS